MEELSQAIADYIEQRKQAKLEPLQKARDKVLAKADDEVAIAKANLDYSSAAAPIEQAHRPSAWLSDAAKRAKQTTRATHTPKFTHSDAKSMSVFVEDVDTSVSYLATRSIKNAAVDFVGNAAALDVVGFLKIESNGESLLNEIRDGRLDSLKFFSSSDDEVQMWMSGFSKALHEEEIKTHSLNKQLYFPLPENKGYLLVCPLYASSLAQKLFDSVSNTKYGVSVEIRKSRRAEQFHECVDEQYPQLIKQTFGATKNARRNFSRLNIDRDGVGYLLRSAPPQYKRQVKPPVNSESIFGREFSYRTRVLVTEFKSFLANLSESDRNFSTRYKRDFSYIQPLVDMLLNYAAEVQSFNAHAGWSSNADCKLKPAHCLWLDIGNQHPQFKAERDKGDWIDVVASDFAKWLNAQLNYKNSAFKVGDVENAYFKKLCLQELKAFERATAIEGAYA